MVIELFHNSSVYFKVWIMSVATNIGCSSWHYRLTWVFVQKVCLGLILASWVRMTDRWVSLLLGVSVPVAVFLPHPRSLPQPCRGEHSSYYCYCCCLVWVWTGSFPPLPLLNVEVSPGDGSMLGLGKQFGSHELLRLPEILWTRVVTPLELSTW